MQRQLGRGVRHGRRGVQAHPGIHQQGGKEVLSGKETFIVTTTGNTKTDTHDFTWKWIDNSREGLILNYGSGDVKIFENVWVREHYLSGKLDGEIMMLTASRYMVNQNWK